MTTQPRIVCPKCQGKRSIYVGCGENVPCAECNSTGEKYLDSAAMLRLKATARTRADIAGRVLAALITDKIPLGVTEEPSLRGRWLRLSVDIADELLAELARTAK